jgi:hypothetical protein
VSSTALYRLPDHCLMPLKAKSSEKYTNWDPPQCCILRGPGRECIVDVVPGGMELEVQVKKGSRAGCTCSQ